MTQTQTAPGQDPDPAQGDRLKYFIESRLRTREAPEGIARAVLGVYGVKLEPDQVVPYWRGEIPLPTQTAHRPDKESVQLAADQAPEPNFTRPEEAEAPASVFSIVPEPTQTGRRQDADTPPEAATQSEHGQDADAPMDDATQTGHRQDAGAPQIPADPVDDPRGIRAAREAAIQALGTLARAKLGIPAGPDPATQTGRRPDEKAKSVLTDEMKVFIVRGLARYETPTRVAAAVQAEFGVEIDRRQVHAYDPAGSRRPAQRWIELHAATRAKFMDAMAEVGVAQKIVRLRMLDRLANAAEERYPERAAKFLLQAALECGGYYERFAQRKAAA